MPLKTDVSYFWDKTLEVFLQVGDGGSPTRRAAVKVEIQNKRMFFEEGMNGLTQYPLPLPVDDPHFINPFIVAHLEILIHHRRRISGGEHVQVKDPIHRIFNLIQIISFPGQPDPETDHEVHAPAEDKLLRFQPPRPGFARRVPSGTRAFLLPR